ncbi:hypothetical protein VPH35_053639 [Triticum aestivum]
MRDGTTRCRSSNPNAFLSSPSGHTTHGLPQCTSHNLFSPSAALVSRIGLKGGPRRGEAVPDGPASLAGLLPPRIAGFEGSPSAAAKCAALAGVVRGVCLLLGWVGRGLWFGIAGAPGSGGSLEAKGSLTFDCRIWCSVLKFRKKKAFARFNKRWPPPVRKK